MMITQSAVLLSILPSLRSFSLVSIPPPRYTIPSPTVCFAASKPTLSISSLYGGDFAGISATFSAHNGALIKVPEHLVPESLLEWGAEPTALETIVSEDVSSPFVSESDNHNNTLSLLTRHTVQILPAVGCGVDNLDTNKQKEIQQMQCLRISESGSAISFDVPLRHGTNQDCLVTRAETSFATRDGNRLRVDLTVEYTAARGFSLFNPIHVILERRLSNDSSQGTIADGGGLTGSKVTELLGPLIQPPLFCDQLPLEWQSPASSGMKVLNLSGNVTIATSLESTQDPWILDVVYVNIDDNGQAEKEVVRRSYHAPKSNAEKATDVE